MLMGVDCIRERLCLKAQNSGFRGLPSDAGKPSKFASLGFGFGGRAGLNEPMLTEKERPVEGRSFPVIQVGPNLRN